MKRFCIDFGVILGSFGDKNETFPALNCRVVFGVLFVRFGTSSFRVHETVVFDTQEPNFEMEANENEVDNKNATLLLNLAIWGWFCVTFWT